MTRPEIILVEPMMPVIEAKLDAAYAVHRLFDAAGRDSALQARPRIRAVVTGGATGIGNDWIEAMPALGIVAINGVGTDRVDLRLTREKGIEVTTTPGTLTEDVADMGMALMLAVLRRIVEGDGFVRAGRWAAREPFPLGGSLKGRRLGILGLGQIGRALATRAAAFGMHIAYWDRAAIPGVDHPWFEDPKALAADSDVLAVCVAATPATAGMVDAGLLAALGPKGVLINIARGNIVDESALIAALRSGRIAAAGLDVFENEPGIDPAFLSLPNAVITPHQASATVETRVAMGEAVLANLAAHFAGARPPAVVN